MSWKVTAIFSAICFGLLAVLYLGFGRDPHHVPFMLRGKPAPPFVLKSLETGERVSSEQLKGHPLVINFWSSWCGPCRTEQPVLDWAARERPEGTLFLGVVFEDSPENAKAFVAENGSSYPQFIDGESTMAVDYGVAGVPETYFIDANGVIVDKYAGSIDPSTLNHLLADMQRRSTGNADSSRASRTAEAR